MNRPAKKNSSWLFNMKQKGRLAMKLFSRGIENREHTTAKILQGLESG